MTYSGKTGRRQGVLNRGLWEIVMRVEAAGQASVPVPRQVHGGTIVPAMEVQDGFAIADGVVIERGPLVAGISTADCLPLVLVTATQALLVHVSRKTLIAGLLDQVESFINSAEIDGVWVGPHICQEHFVFEEAGSQVQEFQRRFPSAWRVSDLGIHLSVRQALQHYFDRWSVQLELLSEDGRCTYEDVALPSYRRALDQGKRHTGQIVTAVRYRAATS